MDSDYSNVRLQPSSSELVALSTLTPPSPILSPSILSTSITSGYIPILLDDLAFPISQRFATAGTFEERRISARTESYLSRSDTSPSIGTFGPVYKRPRPAHGESDCNLPNEHFFHKATETIPRSRFPEPPEPATECLSSQVLVWDANIPKTGRRGTGCESSLYFPGETATRTREVLAPPRIDLGVGFPAYPSKNDKPCEPSASLSEGLKSITEFALKPIVQHTSSRDKAKPSSWLDKIRVVLAIDQEGFRSITPSFMFVGCITQTVDYKQRRGEVVAHFVPVNRKVFHFHYTPFDSLPVLRRISVNDDESRDYISREATLGLKSNGIYSVHGLELVTPPVQDENRGQHSAIELYWEFVYKVEDRRIGPTRKLIDGEKNLIPLSFSCSPALLRSSQGRKVNLMHVVKKTIAARLVAVRDDASE